MTGVFFILIRNAKNKRKERMAKAGTFQPPSKLVE